ncbi:peptidase inhibitor family I36 protein [Actinomadura harenae]|uniref:Peptidase inhibitor family I36 protein n=1 Tax=Actinomadura harenae TaxID=2483351 RepID=A0A3M2LQZ7_9ACTN|nr:peptidase inhibitor family I36 protein [Actinomadura harenae]RMI39300.1 hypothetical protein EBO15_30080 [Actinomadura harenae]
MRYRAARLAVVSLAAFGFAAATASASSADARAAKCPKGHFCLFAGPGGTGKVLLDEDAHITKGGFQLRELDDIEPPIFPRSAFDPLPDDFGCIVRLNDQPNFQGDEQETDSHGLHELDGRRVASLTSDCG